MERKVDQVSVRDHKRVLCLSLLLNAVLVGSSLLFHNNGNCKILAVAPSQTVEADCDEGEDLAFHVALQSKGTQPVFINRVSPSCNCLSASVTDFEVGPNHSVPLNCLFESDGRAGDSIKSVLVESDAAPLIVNMRFQVRERVHFQKRSLDFGSVRVGQRREILVPYTSEGYRLRESRTSEPWLGVQEQLEGQALRVSCSPAMNGHLDSSVVLYFSSLNSTRKLKLTLQCKAEGVL